MSWELSAPSDSTVIPGSGSTPRTSSNPLQRGLKRHPLHKYYLYSVIKLLILVVVLYLGYRLFVGPPLLNSRQDHPAPKADDDDGYSDYEEIS